MKALQDSDLLQQFEQYHAAATPGTAGPPVATPAAEGPRVVFSESSEATAQLLTVKPSTFTTVRSIQLLCGTRGRWHMLHAKQRNWLFALMPSVS